MPFEFTIYPTDDVRADQLLDAIRGVLEDEADSAGMELLTENVTAFTAIPERAVEVSRICIENGVSYTLQALEPIGE
jgi:hypothetical protein